MVLIRAASAWLQERAQQPGFVPSTRILDSMQSSIKCAGDAASGCGGVTSLKCMAEFD